MQDLLFTDLFHEDWYDVHNYVIAAPVGDAWSVVIEVIEMYLPSDEEPANRNVAGLGKPSVFGLTLGNKGPDAKGE